MKISELALNDPVVVSDEPDATAYTVRAIDPINNVVGLQYVNAAGLTVRAGWIDPSLLRRDRRPVAA